MIIEDKIHEKPSTMVSNGSNSSSSSSSEDEKSFEQSFKGTNYIPEKTSAPRKVAIEDKIYEKPSTVSALTDGIFETGAYGVPSKSQNPTVLGQGGSSSTQCSNPSWA